MGFGRVERAAMTVIQMEAMVVIQTVNLSVATHSSILMRSVTMVTGAQGMAVALAVRLSDVEMGIWQALLQTGESIATEAEYEHGYNRNVRDDLVRMVSFRLGREIHAVPIRQALGEIVAMCPDGFKVVPSGQNVRMDVMFLERAFRECAIDYPFDYHVIDLATLFYAWSLVAGETVSALSLRQAATTAGLVKGAVPHRALADSRLTLETFRHYVGRLSLRPASELAEADAPAENRKAR